MLKSIITLFLIFYFSSNSLGQSTSPIVTEAQAQNWFDSLKTQPFNSQLKMISERLLSDTNICTKELQPDRIITKQSNTKIIRCVSAFESDISAKPLIVVNYKIILRIKNSSSKQSIVKLTELLTPNLINKIELFEGPSAAALYGSDGAGGAIILTVLKNKTLQKFKDLRLNVDN